MRDGTHPRQSLEVSDGSIPRLDDTDGKKDRRTHPRDYGVTVFNAKARSSDGKTQRKDGLVVALLPPRNSRGSPRRVVIIIIVIIIILIT